MKTQKEKRKRGPERISPQEMSDVVSNIEGIEQVYTRAQYNRLLEYIVTPIEEREPCVRLGATVPGKKDGIAQPSRSTWAVTVHDKIQIIVRVQDPRQAEVWMTNDSRPWNMYRVSQPMEEISVAEL